ncbi:hypothetical protein GGR56DRAFT_507397 [Xylariaceae sp. FL0804]|nr:hypothetical protein GGR56DRAFT_507397 [Xylariaceae sp. FL0804]
MCTAVGGISTVVPPGIGSIVDRPGSSSPASLPLPNSLLDSLSLSGDFAWTGGCSDHLAGRLFSLFSLSSAIPLIRPNGRGSTSPSAPAVRYTARFFPVLCGFAPLGSMEIPATRRGSGKLGGLILMMGVTGAVTCMWWSSWGIWQVHRTGRHRHLEGYKSKFWWGTGSTSSPSSLPLPNSLFDSLSLRCVAACQSILTFRFSFLICSPRRISPTCSMCLSPKQPLH